MKILAINPGSTSTKIALYEDDQQIFCETIRHDYEILKKFKTIYEQKDYRKDIIIKTLKAKNIALEEIDEFVARGGLVRALKSGVYRINEQFLHDTEIGLQGQHASNLGALLADELAQIKKPGKIAYSVDPPTVDEYDEIAKISGLAGISRVISFHSLNQKAVARRYAKTINKQYDSLNLIVAHMGGGVSIGAHRLGRIIDVNSALGGDGPFSPSRIGALPTIGLIKMCYSGKYSYQEIYNKLFEEGGVYSYLSTNNVMEVETRIKNKDEKAKLILEAMAYKIAKEIGGCGAVLMGKVDAIIITGGIANSKLICDFISERVKFITENIIVYPGEDEMAALAIGVLDALQGKREILDY